MYQWCRLNRERRGALVIPREVRRELAVAATLVLLVEQRLGAPWSPVATLFDASDLGGGICQSPATVEELQSEARWAVRGGWVTAFGSSETLQDLFPIPDATPELEVELAIPRSMKIWVYRSVHLFSGLRRAFDVEHYFSRVGGSRGILVIIESFDAAYGEELDFDNRGRVEDLIERARRGRSMAS